MNYFSSEVSKVSLALYTFRGSFLLLPPLHVCFFERLANTDRKIITMTGVSSLPRINMRDELRRILVRYAKEPDETCSFRSLLHYSIYEILFIKDGKLWINDDDDDDTKRNVEKILGIGKNIKYYVYIFSYT